MQPLLSGPRLRDDVGRRPLLSLPESSPDKRMMSVVPGGLHQDAAEVSIAGLGNRSARLLRAAGMLRGDPPDKRHRLRRTAEAARVAELGGDGQRGQIIDAAEAAQSLDARATATSACAATCRGA